MSAMKNLVCGLGLVLLCGGTPAAAQKTYTYRVVKSYPHDQTAYVQGLFFYNGFLYESNGLYGKSDLRRVDLESGKPLHSAPVDRRYFAEGATIVDGLVYQLTWREGVCLVYDAQTLALKYQLRYSGEGWGLTSDGRRLIMSDGSDVIRFLSPQTLREERWISVRRAAGSVHRLNELELINGELWANIYTTTQIVRIDTATGRVAGIVDLAGILPSVLRTPSTDVLNGIAYDPARRRIFVTGKNWGRLFEIEVIEKK